MNPWDTSVIAHAVQVEDVYAAGLIFAASLPVFFLKTFICGRGDVRRGKNQASF
jgi:hypothetical protein